ncbi:MAG: hypothetical protein JOZ10_02860 [Acidobacteria bacterium]|nr:hypothetical protein [Acidobacteriota bacterium]MBV9438200.1 hypothetical protein [Acidobacteriota bacterium]
MILATAYVGFAFHRAARALRSAQVAVAEESELKFVARPYSPIADTGFDPIPGAAQFAHAAEFQGKIYIAGQTGLYEYDARGQKLRDFHVGRELPASPLLKLARATLANSQQTELVIATAGAGVLAFDGTHFRQILPEQRDARTITSILPLVSGRLLIGTSKRGVLVYDGHRLTWLHPSLAQLQVTELSGTESNLWIGTQERGVVHWHGGAADFFGETDGLPDLHVYAIAQEGDRTFVGTPNGIGEFRDGHFLRVLAAGAFVRSLLPQGKTLLAGTMNDGVLEIALARDSRRRQGLPSIGALMEVEQLFSSGGHVYGLTEAGIFTREGAANWKQVLEPDSGLLTNNDISSLASDENGRLWVGYFDRGLDIVDSVEQAESRRTRHLENDHLFCINRILPNVTSGATAVATANGLVLFDTQAHPRQVLTRTEGLIADHVTDVAAYGTGLVAATPAGLTFIDADGLRSIYAFHGLVNNHVYTLASDGSQLLAGTLGGLSFLNGDEVRASYTTASSNLKHNWITAAVHSGDEWWIGTYGAGVLRMKDAEPGHFESPGEARSQAVINPGAILATDRFVLAGTLGEGIFVLDRRSERSQLITEGLPSRNVTALARQDGYVYVGTDNGLVRIAEQRLLP